MVGLMPVVVAGRTVHAIYVLSLSLETPVPLEMEWPPWLWPNKWIIAIATGSGTTALGEMTVMLTCRMKGSDYGQHDQGYAGLALPTWQFSSAVKMGVIHGSDLG